MPLALLIKFKLFQVRY